MSLHVQPCTQKTSSSQFFLPQMVPNITQQTASSAQDRLDMGKAWHTTRAFPWSPGNCQETPGFENGCFSSQTCIVRESSQEAHRRLQFRHTSSAKVPGRQRCNQPQFRSLMSQCIDTFSLHKKLLWVTRSNAMAKTGKGTGRRLTTIHA